MKTMLLTKDQIALVDDEDFEWLSQWKWSASKTTYGWVAVRGVTRGKKKRLVLMHREITKAPLGVQVDHWDHNGLNNQKENLRFASVAQNQGNARLRRDNTSGYKGVSVADDGKFVGNIHINGSQKYLGRFEEAVDAAMAYDAAAVEHFGEFACTNAKLGLIQQPT